MLSVGEVQPPEDSCVCLGLGAQHFRATCPHVIGQQVAGSLVSTVFRNKCSLAISQLSRGLLHLCLLQTYSEQLLFPPLQSLLGAYKCLDQLAEFTGDAEAPTWRCVWEVGRQIRTQHTWGSIMHARVWDGAKGGASKMKPEPRQ